jgi:hypothetical protein
MSLTGVNAVLERLISDPNFRMRLVEDPTGALGGFDLSDDEKSTLRSGDKSRIEAIGVDQRLTKQIALDPLTGRCG